MSSLGLRGCPTCLATNYTLLADVQVRGVAYFGFWWEKIIGLDTYVPLGRYHK